jgi:hypothetical protein
MDWNTFQPPVCINNVGGVVASTVTLVKAVQKANAPAPITVTPAGMTTLVKALQLRNIPNAILVTLLPIVTLVKPVQPTNA